MVSTPVLFDTVILIDYLRGVTQARVECDRHTDRAISIITWMEILAGATAANEADARTLLLNFQLLPLTPEIAERAVAVRRASKIKLPDAIIKATAEVAVRRASKIKLPDAIIKATAEVEGRVLITRNTRDFPASTVGIHIPYTI